MLIVFVIIVCNISTEFVGNVSENIQSKSWSNEALKLLRGGEPINGEYGLIHESLMKGGHDAVTTTSSVSYQLNVFPGSGPSLFSQNEIDSYSKQGKVLEIYLSAMYFLDSDAGNNNPTVSHR